MCKHLLVSLSKKHNHLLGFANQGSLCACSTGSDLVRESVSAPQFQHTSLCLPGAHRRITDFMTDLWGYFEGD
jgi:hypothetical protein